MIPAKLKNYRSPAKKSALVVQGNGSGFRAARV